MVAIFFFSWSCRNTLPQLCILNDEHLISCFLGATMPEANSSVIAGLNLEWLKGIFPDLKKNALN